MVTLAVFDVVFMYVTISVLAVLCAWQWVTLKSLRLRAELRKDEESMYLADLTDGLQRALDEQARAIKLLARLALKHLEGREDPEVRSELKIVPILLKHYSEVQPGDTWDCARELVRRVTWSRYWTESALRQAAKGNPFSSASALFTAARYATGRLKD